jgi:hypothetical protein
MVSVVITTNPGLANQVETGNWLKAGFAAHGIEAEVTADKNKKADVRVMQGPWYAYAEGLEACKRGEKILYLDRCFYGSPRFDISLGWLRPDGSRDFLNDSAAVPKGTLPRIKAVKDDRRCAVIFGDYNDPRDMQQTVREARKRFDSVFFRPHPAQKRETPVMTLPGELDACWALADVAIGHSSTVLVEAAIEGLHVESSDPRHVIHDIKDGDRQAWLTRLSYAQWNYTELMAGDFWEHLQ